MFDAENAAWISVEERLPPQQPGLLNLTDDVWIRFRDGRILKAFYNYKHDRWHTGDAKTHSNSEITHWAEIVRKGKEKHR